MHKEQEVKEGDPSKEEEPNVSLRAISSLQRITLLRIQAINQSTKESDMSNILAEEHWFFVLFCLAWFG